MIDLITAVERVKTAAHEAFEPPPGYRPDARGEWNGDAAALAAALRERVSGEVRFDDGSRALYATDASNYRQVPIGVVVPRTVDDIVATVAAAREFGAPVLARGGGTSLAGQCCNVAVVLDCSKYFNRVLEVNEHERWARVEPGIVLDDLRAQVAPYGLWFGPDPATHTHNTLGGMIGNNSCGMHAQLAGKTEENTLELDVLTYDGLRLTVGPTDDRTLEELCARADRTGEIYRGLRGLRDAYADQIRARFPRIPRRVSGFALDQLLPENGFNVARALVGTECSCVLVLGAKVKLMPNPAKRCILVAGYKDIFDAGDHVPDVNRHQPIALEGLDDKLIDMMRVKHLEQDDLELLPKGSGWLMCEFGSVDDLDEALGRARACRDDLHAKGALDTKLIVDENDQKRLWAIREAGLGATAKVPNHVPTHPGWEDSACPPDQVGPYLRELSALFAKHGYHPALYGHFGQGCIHCRVGFDLDTAAGIANWKAFLREAAELVTRYGGSLSGEHGDGQARAEFLGIMYGDELVEAFRRFKRLWDPDGRMNPGKAIDAYPVDSNLREGPHYRPWDPSTHFSFEIDDRGSFAYAANRCVGVGDCRRHDGKNVMCPSYRVTREEKHSTRGRARLLFEMLEGAPLRDGWRSEAVKDALDLCLACKGCKGDCPVNVDMATYKAEFLAHYYEGRPRPVWAYAFGLIMYWAHVASLAPRAVNALAQAPGISRVLKAAARMAPQRRIPAFSQRTFRDWYAEHRGRTRPNTGEKRVVLWADTFNDHFHAETAQHALEVLETAGFDVVVPRERLCCGRPLYDYGMLTLAKTFVRQIVDALRDEIEAGTPVVVLEPSCASVFRDELPNLLPHDHDARRLANQVVTLAELLDRENWTPPRLERDARVHPHCHHHAVLGTKADHRILERMGVRAEWLDDGCCGMAGAFGFEAGEHYDVSVACGELGYLPHVRESDERAIVMSDGFSCREQAAQITDRQALHLADVIWLALRYGPRGPDGTHPERAAMPLVADQVARAHRDALGAVLTAGAIAGGLAAGAVAAWRTRPR